jgi:hypothetical protein
MVHPMTGKSKQLENSNSDTKDFAVATLQPEDGGGQHLATQELANVGGQHLTWPSSSLEDAPLVQTYAVPLHKFARPPSSHGLLQWP